MKLLDSALYRNDLEIAAKAFDFEKLRSKTIFITGGLGLICSTIVDLLIVSNEVRNLNVKIIVGARSKGRFDVRYGGENVRFFYYDAQKDISLDFSPDYIIHGAGAASPELYTRNPVETLLSNIVGIKNLLEYSKENRVEKLLYISSSEVYGKKETEGAFREGEYGIIDIDSIRSSYPVAKQASEMLCKAYTAEYDINTTIVRPGHIYGPSASSMDNKISSDFPYKAAKGEMLEMKSLGLQKRSYCYSVDAATAILLALLNGGNGTAYNIGHDQITSIREMAETVAKAGGVVLSAVNPTEEDLRSFNPMNNSSLDNDRIKNIGYRDCFSVQQGLEHTVKILKEINE